MKKRTEIKVSKLIERLIKEDIQQMADEINSAVRAAKSGDLEHAAQIYVGLPTSYMLRLKSTFVRLGVMEKIEAIINDDWTDPAGGVHGRFALNPSDKYK